MLSITYEGNNNTIDLINTSNLVITGYEGLDQPTSEVITLQNPNLRGTQYQRSQISDRQVSLSFAVYNVENTRYQLMNVFKSGEKGILTLKNDFREGEIECYFEEMVFGKFNNPTTCTIFLRCPNPYFTGLEEIVNELGNAINMFVLEAYIPEEGIILGELTQDHIETITNDSDIEIGLNIEIIATDTVVNPAVYNLTTNQFIGINRTLNIGEVLLISTKTGQKRVVVNNNGSITNVINTLMPNSSFFQLKRGDNEIQSSATSGGINMNVYLKYREEYEAI